MQRTQSYDVHTDINKNVGSPPLPKLHHSNNNGDGAAFATHPRTARRTLASHSPRQHASAATQHALAKPPSTSHARPTKPLLPSENFI